MENTVSSLLKPHSFIKSIWRIFLRFINKLCCWLSIFIILCDCQMIPQSLIDDIDKNRNCEDIAMSHIVALRVSLIFAVSIFYQEINNESM